ncbi:MAG: TVP38/TMEM64 family protein [Gammaproteobacteria bacterium]|nr:TVP38/TMEM64 family protein [Gammaproteobacteria bacterium]
MKNKKILYFLIVTTIISLFTSNLDVIEDYVTENINFLITYYFEHTYLFLLVYFFVYILLTAFSIPIALVLGLGAGFIMELYQAIILVSFASSIGATLAMLLARYFFYNLINIRFHKEISIINNEFDNNGNYYLFALRMAPIFPFFIINAVFGLTKIKIWAFYVISQIGMLPGTVLIIIIGNELNELVISNSYISLDLLIYLSLLGVIPLTYKKLFQK